LYLVTVTFVSSFAFTEMHLITILLFSLLFSVYFILFLKPSTFKEGAHTF